MVFKVRERVTEFGRKRSFHQYLMITQFKHEIQMLDVDRAYLLTGAAARAVPELGRKNMAVFPDDGP